MIDDGDGPHLTPGQAKKAAREFLERDEHKPHPDHTGRDPRDERTRTDDLTDPTKQQED
jgi:hypothetical protein